MLASRDVSKVSSHFFLGGDKKASEQAMKEALKRSKRVKLIFEEADWAEY